MRKLGLVLLIILIAAVLRLWMLNGGDVTDDEKHYILDAQRLLNKDPYTSIRHHPFKHPEPSIGHPFLYQIEQVLIFKIFGLSVYTSRLPNALSGIAIVFLLFLFTKQLGGRVAILAAFFTSVLPMAVRYSRNAQLDTVFTFWISLTALSMWRYLNENKKYWLLAAGVCAGLTISTKLNGVYAVLMIALLLVFAKGEKFSVKLLRRVFLELVWVLLPAGIISFLLNDPGAYLDGIIHPSFEAYSFFSENSLTQRLSFLFSPESMYPFLKANFLLLSPIFMITTVAAFCFLILKGEKLVRRFLLLWIFSFLNLFIIHGFRMDGVYGWVPFIPPVVLTVSYSVNNLQKRRANLLVFTIIIFLIPFLFWYGLSFKPLPFSDFPLNHNRTINQNFYQETVEKVNAVTPKNGKVYFLPQIYYPLYALRTDISWAYYGYLNTFDTYVVESENLLNDVSDKIELVENKVSYQDGLILDRKIYKRVN